MPELGLLVILFGAMLGIAVVYLRGARKRK